MGWFRKKSWASTLRFCLKASELNPAQLYTYPDLRIAISRLSEWKSNALEASSEAVAFGVAHDLYGHDQPLLPVAVRFKFGATYRDGDAGHGSVYLCDYVQPPHYRAEFVIHDPDRLIYAAFQKVMEHAAMCGITFAHLILRRHRKEPFIRDSADRSRAGKAERERLRVLMDEVDAGREQLPDIEFDEVAMDDKIILKAPRWTHDWEENFIDGPPFQSLETGRWREMTRL